MIVVVIFGIAILLSEFDTRGFYATVDWATVSTGFAAVSVILAFLGVVLWFLGRHFR